MPELAEKTVPRDDDPVTPEERQQAVRLLIRLVAAGLAVIMAAGVALLLTRDDNEFDFGGEVTLINAIGPLSGRDLAKYQTDRRRALRAATGPRAAVVSFGSYLKEPDARRLLEGLQVRALLVAAPGGTPAVVPGDLAAWADKAKRDAAAERAELERLIPTFDPAEDKDFIEDAKAQIARLQRLEAAAAADGDVVFGVLVTAPADDLRRMAQTTNVRFVDVGTSAAAPALSRVRGIRPEEATFAGDPLTRPA